jgi:hypothetical protein
MTPWSARVSEERSLFNPAFIGALVAAGASGYRESGRNLPLMHAFVLVPLILYKQSRVALPRSLRTSLAAWVQEHPVARADVVARTRPMVPIVREGVLFGAIHGLLELGPDATLSPDRAASQVLRLTGDWRTAEIDDCLKKAAFVGRWFGRSGTPETVLILWGVRP